MLTFMSATYKPPGQPGRPEMVDVGNDWCTIKFTPPADDGGSPITGYRIGYRYKRGGLWETKPRLATKYTVKVDGLIEGSEVEFRVSAVNEAGEGKPSETSEFVLITD